MGDLSSLPKVDDVLSRLSTNPLPRARLKLITREVIAELRQGLVNGGVMATSVDDVCQEVLNRAGQGVYQQRVINATGVVLHTNLGRAPLSDDTARLLADLAAGYSNLEYDLDTGARGGRLGGVSAMLKRLTGAESAVVVNNNAAAVLLMLSSVVSHDKDGIIVSRGELVEIGGSFRIPDVIAQGGAGLVEVGTTNKTKPRDYQAAINSRAAAVLKVHTSNFKIRGFTEDVGVSALSELCDEFELPLIYDLGGGALIDLGHGEPTVQSLVPHCHMLSFSGDKLMGGPQAGIILGKAGYIDRLKLHPLYRALRVDKLSLLALEMTLQHYLDEEYHKIPAIAMLTATDTELLNKAQTLLARLMARPCPYPLELVKTQGRAGGGTLPDVSLGSYAVAIDPAPLAPQRLDKHLRAAKTPIISRIHQGKLLLDVRTISTKDYEEISCRLSERPGM